MKRAVFTAILMIAMIFGVEAQRVWVGGSLGFESFSFENEISPNFEKTRSFSVNPEIGFSLSKRFDIGLSAGFGTERNEFSRPGWPIRISGNEKITSWAIAPFVQYTALQFGRVRLLCRATVGFESHNGLKAHFDHWNGLVFRHDQNARFSGFSANITPYVFLDISRRISLFTAMNFLSLNFSHMTTKLNGVEQNTFSNFNVGVDVNNVFNTGNLQFGFIFKF